MSVTTPTLVIEHPAPAVTGRGLADWIGVDMARVTPARDRFWAKVDKDGPVHPRLGTRCWVWTGSINPNGYGSFGVNSARWSHAHRYSYELATGMFWEWFAKLDIDHRCHNRLCVNPAHLRPATRGQNLQNLTGARRKSSSGVRGVQPNHKRWMARVQHNGEQIYLGTFDTIEEAGSAAKAKRLELFTHNDVDRS